MTIVKFTLDPNNPPQLTPEQRARLDAMTEEDINRAALSDPDNLPMTDAELLQLTAVGLSKRTRAKTGLTQEKFAEVYGLNVARLRDLEQGRVNPDRALLGYLAMIEDDPERARRVVEALDLPG